MGRLAAAHQTSFDDPVASAVFANPTRPKERPPEGGLGKA